MSDAMWHIQINQTPSCLNYQQFTGKAEKEAINGQTGSHAIIVLCQHRRENDGFRAVLISILNKVASELGLRVG